MGCSVRASDLSNAEVLTMHEPILNRTLVHALGCLVTMGMAVAIGADEAKSQERAATDAAKVSPPATSRSDTASDVVREYNDVRASRLIGMFVRSPANERMGQIKDLIVDVNNARVRYAVLEFKGEIFVSKKLFVFPLTAFKSSMDGEHLILGIEKAKLAAAPGFTPDRWPDWHARYSSEIDRHFGLAPPSARGRDRRLVRASRYLGAEVHDAQGRDIGDVVELVVNLNDGEIHYAVVAFDKPWSINDKLVAVPLGGFDVSDEGQLRVNLSRDVIAHAPGMTRREWPTANLSQNAWIGEVDRYALSAVSPAQAAARDSRPSDVQDRRKQ
jgi:sporulation protein YlmC with PRC-barrel domain